MNDFVNSNLNYDRPVKIAEDVYWVGFFDENSGLHCNPYLIIDGEEAILLDSGSRPDFPTVMMKILQTGFSPENIKALIYSHYDPDLCGGIPNFESIINNKDLKIISDKNNNPFIRHYSVTSKLHDIGAMHNCYSFSSGRKLEFIKTPYSHSAGSFITFDHKTEILFTSDIFGSYSQQWKLFISLDDNCHICKDYKNCPDHKEYCPIPDMLKFHKTIMTSVKALRYAMDIIDKIPYKMIAPQHGSIIYKTEDAKSLINILNSKDDIGIDGII